MYYIPRDIFKNLVEKYPDYITKAIVNYNGVNKGDWMMFECLVPEICRPQDIHSYKNLTLIVEHKHFEIV